MYEHIPEKWKQDPTIKWVMITAYQIMRVENPLPHGQGFSAILEDLNISLFIGSGNVFYHESILESKWDQKEDDLLCGQGLELKTIEDTHFLLIFAICDIDKDLIREDTTRERIDSISGLLGLHFGRNIFYKKLYTQFLNLSDKQEMLDSNMIVHPEAFPKLGLDKVELDKFWEIASLLMKSDVRSRLMLSLEYFQESITSMPSYKKFLSYWQAIEILCMPNTTDIRPVRELLGRLYDLSYFQVKSEDRFLIGKLFGIRSKIVHQGFKFFIDFDLEKYLQLLYKELFLGSLGYTFEKEVDKYYQQNRQRLIELLSI